jgi:hypothetical protein
MRNTNSKTNTPKLALAPNLFVFIIFPQGLWVNLGLLLSNLPIRYLRQDRFLVNEIMIRFHKTQLYRQKKLQSADPKIARDFLIPRNYFGSAMKIDLILRLRLQNIPWLRETLSPLKIMGALQ